MTLTAHPAAARPGASVAIIVYFIAMALIAGPWLMGRPLLSPLGGLGALLVFDALVLAMARWFFPTRYRFDEDGIHVRFLGMERRYPYARFRSIQHTRGGVFLSPRKDPTRFDRFRGLFLIIEHPDSWPELSQLLAERLSCTFTAHSPQ